MSVDNDGRGSRVWLFAGVLVVAYLILTLWNIQLQTIASPDEPRYADAARVMLDSGDWVVPKFNAAPRLVKPVFFYWLLAGVGAVGSALGAPLGTAFRFGPALMGLLVILGTFLLGTRLRGERFGFISAAILLTTFEFHKLSRELVCDMTLTAWLLWAWLFFHIASKRIERSQSAFPALLGFYLCLGFACLTKGPFLVAIFVVMPLLAYLWLTSNFKLLLRAGIYWGAPISLLIGMWWSVAIQRRGLDAGSFILTENIKRFLGAKDHTQNPTPFVFYLKTLGENFAPWIVLLPVALYWSLRFIGVIPSGDASAPKKSIKQALYDLSDASKLQICCLAIPFFIMGISVSKRPLYLLPIYPFLALWAGWLVETTFLKKEGQSFCTRCAYTLGAILVVLFGGLAIAVGGFSDQLLALLTKKFPDTLFKPMPSEIHMATVLLVILAVFGLAAALNLKVGRRFNFMVQILAMAAALVIGYETVVVPNREREADRIQFFAALQERIKDRPLVTFEESQNEAVWYLNRPTQQIKQLRRPDLKAWFEHPDAVLLTPENDAKHKMDPRFRDAIRVLGPAIPRGDMSFILVEPDPAHPPDPEIFKPLPAKSGHHQKQAEDDQGDE